MQSPPNAVPGEVGRLRRMQLESEFLVSVQYRSLARADVRESGLEATVCQVGVTCGRLCLFGQVA